MICIKFVLGKSIVTSLPPLPCNVTAEILSGTLCTLFSGVNGPVYYTHKHSHSPKHSFQLFPLPLLAFSPPKYFVSLPPSPASLLSLRFCFCFNISFFFSAFVVFSKELSFPVCGRHFQSALFEERQRRCYPGISGAQS